MIGIITAMVLTVLVYSFLLLRFGLRNKNKPMSIVDMQISSIVQTEREYPHFIHRRSVLMDKCPDCGCEMEIMQTDELDSMTIEIAYCLCQSYDVSYLTPYEDFINDLGE